MTKYIIGEIFSSGGATLYKNPSDQTVLGSENVEKIPTRDDLDLLQMTNLKVILVDHHVLPSHYQGLLPKVEEIIDHRTVLSEFDPKVLQIYIQGIHYGLGKY